MLLVCLELTPRRSKSLRRVRFALCMDLEHSRDSTQGRSRRSSTGNSNCPMSLSRWIQNRSIQKIARMSSNYRNCLSFLSYQIHKNWIRIRQYLLRYPRHLMV